MSVTKEEWLDAYAIMMDNLFDNLQGEFIKYPLPFGNCRCIPSNEPVYNPEFVKFWNEYKENKEVKENDN